MIQFEACVFDDFIPSSTAVYTGVQHMKALGAGDQIGLFLVADLIPGTGISASVYIEHSSDGRNWLSKNSSSADLTGGVNVGRTPLFGGELWPTKPSLEYVRLKIQLTTTLTPASGHVQLFATVRDRGGKAACDCACGEKRSPLPLAVQTELATLRAEEPKDVLQQFHRNLGGGASMPERVHAALSQMTPEERAELLAHTRRVSTLSVEARKELLRGLLDEA